MASPELLTQVNRAIEEVSSGQFHAEWVQEQKAGKPNMDRLWRQALEHPLATSEAKLESLRKIIAGPCEGERG
jgi:ketol-acid reductoisomerase